MWRTVKLRPVSYFENSACQKLSLLKLSLPEQYQYAVGIRQCHRRGGHPGMWQMTASGRLSLLRPNLREA